jgi:prepilin-type N-terminal cleavage/methylation domain-containing protein
MSQRRDRAFTLIELLVVILIIAVISAVVVPAFAGYYAKARFESAIRQVEDYFALAREKAVKGDTTVTLHFETGTHVFSIAIDPLPPQNDMPTAMLTAEGTDLGGSQDVMPFRLGDEFRVESFHVTAGADPSATTQSDVRFHGDGTSDGAELVVVSRQGFNAHLVLSPMDGRLTLAGPAR